MKIDPYYQQPVTLVSENTTRMRIFAGVLRREGVKRQSGYRQRQLSAIYVAISSETLELRSAVIIIWRYATPVRPVTDCKMNDLE